MTPKQTALINVAKMFSLALLAGAVTGLLLMHVPLPLLGIGVCVIMMLFLIHWIYELELSKAEHLEALNTLNKMK
jgi:Flp pilus assembly protein TadB